MILLIAVVLLGGLLGYFLPLGIAFSGNLYVILAILVAIHSLLEILYDMLNKRERWVYWGVGFMSNLLLSLFLIFLSERLGVPLYYAVIFYCGVGIFDFSKKIRVLLLGN